MKNKLWGGKIQWQINCIGTVLLIHGLHVLGAASGRCAEKHPGNEKHSNYLGT